MEREAQDINIFAHLTQDHQFKGEKELNDLTEFINFLSDKFREYKEDRAQKDKIIEDLKSEVDSLSTKEEKFEKLEEQYPARTILKKKLPPNK